MASPHTALTSPIRFVDRQLRANAERTFFEGMDLLAGMALAFEGVCAGDTPTKARILADLLEAGTARVLRATRLLDERAGGR